MTIFVILQEQVQEENNERKQLECSLAQTQPKKAALSQMHFAQKKLQLPLAISRLRNAALSENECDKF